jgi:Protein of unknown function (DUF2721)
MDPLNAIPTVAHVIQQALTPVFLLGGVATILNVLAGRLARAVDRFRLLSESERNLADAHKEELLTLQLRVRYIHWAIILCTVSGLFVCASIVILFLGAELGVNLSRAVSFTFIAAIFALTGGLLTILREITLATGRISLQKIC